MLAAPVAVGESFGEADGGDGEFGVFTLRNSAPMWTKGTEGGGSRTLGTDERERRHALVQHLPPPSAGAQS